jgi:tetratricopeptide (TPR) repeat protein
MLQIKEVSPSGEPTKLELTQGRAWTQAKRKEFTAPTPGSTPAVTVQTPNAVAAIRGTDWEISVEKDGSATLTVLSGEVEFYNDLGRVSVRPNEQARVEPGKAPVKTLLTNAADRVQWVTSYRPQPHRWLPTVPAELAKVVAAEDGERYGEAFTLLPKGDKLSPAAALLKADLLIFQGEARSAAALLDQTLAANAGSPLAARLTALLARALSIAGQPEAARAKLAQKSFDDVEYHLARGDLARLDGDAPTARAAYQAALAVSGDKSADAWYGLGRVASERESVKEGRAALGKAIELDPKGAGYRGELATLESFANELPAAQAEFEKALAQHPDDYAALTGLGILQLKQGDPDAALESFLKAGVIEPRYARAQLYTGVAYYQLGNHQRASEMFKRAAALDAKDPLPYMMLSLVAADRMEMGNSVAAARQASQLMPYLKSVNQLLNNQKGNANVGASLAQFGLEEWAQSYAHNSYSPYWAGSSLFLADRYSGDFNKNSELFKGFLADPVVFGASNRFNSLVARPGAYGAAGARAVNGDTLERGGNITGNGYLVAPAPIAWYASVDPTRIRPDRDNLKVDADNYTIGLGAKPTHELGLFAFANQFSADGRQITPLNPGGENNELNNRRVDLGASYKFSPTSQVWLKAGSGIDKVHGWGNIATPDAILSSFLNTVVENPATATGTLVKNDTTNKQRDIQFRHTLDVSSSWQLSWGAESGRQDKSRQFLGNFGQLSGAGENADQRRSNELWLSNRIKLNPTLLLQGDLSRISMHMNQWQDNRIVWMVYGVPAGGTNQLDRQQFDKAEWNPRLGLAWNPVEGQTLRVAAQKWRRPASVASLGQVDTAGIAVDDRLVGLGGELKRFKVQYEWEVSPTTFVQGFLDTRRIHNLANASNTLIADTSLQDLERLRNRNRLTTQSLDFLEATPEFGEAKVDTLGLAANRVLADNLSGSVRYQYNRSHNTATAFSGNTVPWLPKHLANAGLTWLPAARWQLSASATYRSSRFQDEANTQPLAGGWNFGLRSYWESVDKRHSVEAILENLHGNKQSAVTRSPIFGAQYLYRF